MFCKEIHIPPTLKKIGYEVFEGCPNIGIVWVEGDYPISKEDLCSLMSVFQRHTVVGDRFLWDLRRLSRVSIPDGIQRIESRWFWNSDVEEVNVLASVQTIGAGAFQKCAKLRKVVFAEGSLLQTLENSCFEQSGLEEFLAPESLRCVEHNAFSNCKNLKKVVLNEDLGTLENAFSDSAVESVLLPHTLKTLHYEMFMGCEQLRSI